MILMFFLMMIVGWMWLDGYAHEFQPLVLTSQTGFVVTDQATHRVKNVAVDTLTIEPIERGLLLNGKLVPTGSLRIEPMSGVIHVSSIGNQATCAACVLVPSAHGYDVDMVPVISAAHADTSPHTLVTIKVLLCSVIDGIDHAVTIESKGGVRLVGDNNTVITEKASMTIHKKGDLVYINKKPYGLKNFLCTPLDPALGLTIGTSTYAGQLEGKMVDHQLLIINHVELEEYVSSVLHTESWPGWPVEVNMAFAIASRSYVMSMVMRAMKSNKPYHVCNTNHHQTYRGNNYKESIKKAVRETKGMLLVYQDEPILAMFDSCCGGIIPANIADVDFSMTPYLKRLYPCTYCKKSRMYEWTIKVDLSALEQKIAHEIKPIKKIKDIKVVEDKAGLVSKIVVKGPKKSVPISYNAMRSALKGIRSRCFLVKKKNNDIVVHGRGVGHHIGLCQWGACEMVKDGWAYGRILSFYYPGVALKHIDTICAG